VGYDPYMTLIQMKF